MQDEATFCRGYLCGLLLQRYTNGDGNRYRSLRNYVQNDYYDKPIDAHVARSDVAR